MKEMKSRWKDDSDLVTEPVKWLSKLEAIDFWFTDSTKAWSYKFLTGVSPDSMKKEI